MAEAVGSTGFHDLVEQVVLILDRMMQLPREPRKLTRSARTAGA